MNKGLEILMARMDSHPEEFTDTMRWGRLLDNYEDVFDEEDIKTFRTKHNALHQQHFTEQVMKELFKEQEEKNEEAGMYISAMQAQAQLNAIAQQQMYNAAQAGSLTGLGSYPIPSASPYTIRESNKVASEIRVGKQTLTEKTIKKLKALVK